MPCSNAPNPATAPLQVVFGPILRIKLHMPDDDSGSPTPAQIRDYCARYADSISVRVLRGSHFERATLASVSPPERRGLVESWVTRRFFPRRDSQTAAAANAESRASA